MKTLLEKAKEIHGNRPQVHIGEEQIELAIAYLKDEVSIKSATLALGKRAGATSAYITIARALKEAYRLDLIK